MYAVEAAASNLFLQLQVKLRTFFFIKLSIKMRKLNNNTNNQTENSSLTVIQSIRFKNEVFKYLCNVLIVSYSQRHNKPTGSK